MVRRIQIVLDDEKFEEVKKLKGNLSWEKFFLSLVEKAKGKTSGDFVKK